MTILTLAQKKKLWIKANKAYHNTDKPLMSDTEFDALEEKIRKLDPSWTRLNQTGARLGKKVSIRLAHFQPSLGKAYPEELPKWLAKQDQSVVIMPKLDGSSLQVVYENGKLVRVATRGDGIHGKDITFLAPHLNILQNIRAKGRWVLRCEAVIKQKVFEKKYAAEFDNPRNLVNGALNRTHATPVLADTDIVVLAVLEPTGSLASGLRKMELAGGPNGFNIVDWKLTIISSVTDWGKLLANTRKRCPYEADGLVLVNANSDVEYKNADKPKWAIAYKENLSEADAPTAKVKQVIWQTSHRGRLIPKVEIEPLRLDGVTVKFATVHNAKWMEDRGIGPGAKIKIVRSGGVIPKIVGVVKPGKIRYPKAPHKWKGVHLVLDTKEDNGFYSDTMQVRKLHKFFSVVGIENIALKTLAVAFDAGLQTVADFLRVTDTKHYEAAGIGKVLSHKLLANVESLRKQPIQLRQLMRASSCFDAGIGDRRLSLFEKHIKLSLLLNMSDAKIVQKLITIPGVREKTAQVFVEGLREFRPWLKEVHRYFECISSDVPKPAKPKKGSLTGKCFSWTGYRSAEQEARIQELGGEVIPFGSRTSILFYKEGGKQSSKIEKAQAKGIKVTTWERFKGLK